MRGGWLAAVAALCLGVGSAGAQGVGPAASGNKVEQAAVVTPVPESVIGALGVEPALGRLRELQGGGQGSGLEALQLRQQVMEQVMLASFDVDAMLGRIDTEATYASEDRYLVENRKQRQNNLLNLTTFAVSGALGAAGSGMQLTAGLNHAGQAVGLASSATAVILSAVQLKGASGGKQALRSPYNMLAEILGQEPNEASRYPPLVKAYLQAPSRKDGRPLEESLPAVWRRLKRLQNGAKSDGASLESATTDSSHGAKLGDDELADREAMLHDLHATVVLLQTELRQVLLEVVRTTGGISPEAPAH